MATLTHSANNKDNKTAIVYIPQPLRQEMRLKSAQSEQICSRKYNADSFNQHPMAPDWQNVGQHVTCRVWEQNMFMICHLLQQRNGHPLPIIQHSRRASRQIMTLLMPGRPSVKNLINLSCCLIGRHSIWPPYCSTCLRLTNKALSVNIVGIPILGSALRNPSYGPPAFWVSYKTGIKPVQMFNS